MMMNNNYIYNMFGGFNYFMNQFNAFKQQFMNSGISPQEQVQQLLNSGQMTQQQFDELRMLANQITGKNL